MPANDYKFVTHWRVKGDIARVYDLLADPIGYKRWWPQVYLETEVERPGDENLVGQKVRLLTKGRLPYTLAWELTVVEVTKPFGFKIRAEGDFDGYGVWQLQEDGDHVNATFHWEIRADKPLIKLLSPILKPIFRWNHGWAMERGREGLLRELSEIDR